MSRAAQFAIAGALGAIAASGDTSSLPPYIRAAIESVGLRMISFAEKAKGEAAVGSVSGQMERELSQFHARLDDMHRMLRERGSHSTIVLSPTGTGGWRVVMVVAGAGALGYVYLRVSGSSLWDVFPATRMGLAALQKSLNASLQSVWESAHARFEALRGKSEEIAQEVGAARCEIGRVEEGVGRLDGRMRLMDGKVDHIGRLALYQAEMSRVIGRVLSRVAIDCTGPDSEDARKLAALAEFDPNAEPLLLEGGYTPMQAVPALPDSRSASNASTSAAGHYPRPPPSVSATYPPAVAVSRASDRTSSFSRIVGSLFGGAEATSTSEPQPLPHQPTGGAMSDRSNLWPSVGSRRGREDADSSKADYEYVTGRGQGGPGLGTAGDLRSAGSGRFTEFIRTSP